MAIVKRMRKIAIEFLLAKKPLNVETRPMMAIRVAGRLICGARKVLSTTPCHEKKGRKACLSLIKYFESLKFFENSRGWIASGCLIKI